VPARAGAQTVIAAADAGAHIGEDVTVEGDVPTVVCSPLACLLSFTTDYSGLVASIPGDVLGSFPPPKETYGSRRVRVRGVVVDKNGRPRIEVRDPGYLQVVGGGGGSPIAAPVVHVPLSSDGVDARAAVDAIGAEPVAPAAKPAREDAATQATRSRVVDPGHVTSRAGLPSQPVAARPSGESVVARLSGGEADVGTVEAHALRQEITKLEQANAALSETVAALEERLTVLEQSQGGRFAGVQEAPLPEIHDYVVSGDNSNRVQRITRGWSSERVLRVLGAPVNTTTEANGYMTWYYSNGRAVTLDSRGRVVSSIGF